MRMHNGIQTSYFESPIGTMEIRGDEQSVHSVQFRESPIVDATDDIVEPILRCRNQLAEFFEGSRKEFDLPVRPEGTTFQKEVWQALQQIPFGKTISYSELALQMGDIKTVRAVGSANARNPIAVIVPCHRVIGMDHKLVGYAGGLWRKQWLLEHEEKYAKGILRLFDN